MDKLMQNKFWVALGAVALVVVVLFALGPCSLRSQNKSQLEELKDRADELRSYERKEVENEKWVEQQEEIKNDMEQQLRQIQEELLSRDSLLEEHLDDPETDSSGPLSFGRFPSAYEAAMEEIETKLEDSVIEISSDTPLVRKELGSDWLTQEVLHGYEKQWQIQKEIVDAIAELNEEADVVPVFDSFRFKDQPERHMSQAHDEYFDPIPFELKIAMEFEFYPLFLERMLRIPLDPEVTSVQIRRYEEAKREQPRRTSSERAEERSREYGEDRWDQTQRRRSEREEEREESEEEEVIEEETLPQDLVFVVLNGYIPDYGERDDDSDDSESESEDRRRRRR